MTIDSEFYLCVRRALPKKKGIRTAASRILFGSSLHGLLDLKSIKFLEPHPENDNDENEEDEHSKLSVLAIAGLERKTVFEISEETNPVLVANLRSDHVQNLLNSLLPASIHLLIVLKESQKPFELVLLGFCHLKLRIETVRACGKLLMCNRGQNVVEIRRTSEIASVRSSNDREKIEETKSSKKHGERESFEICFRVYKRHMRVLKKAVV